MKQLVAIKIAKALGAHVVVFITSVRNVADAELLGADETVLFTDATQMSKYASSLNMILDTVSAKHDINVYLNLPRVDSSVVLIGLPPEQLPIGVFNMIKGRRIF